MRSRMTLPSFLMIDDFLDDPLDARLRALALTYDPGTKKGNFPGLTSEDPLPIAGLDERVSALIGRRVGPAHGALHGHCRLTLKNDRGLSGVHVDPAFYSGILYLSLPEHCRGGTYFYRHRRTGLERVPLTQSGILGAGYADVNDLIHQVVNQDTHKESRWERSFVAPMRFNRLILFSPWMFHNSAAGFGDRPENGRLVQLMFFEAR